MECQVCKDFGLEYIVDKDATNSGSADYVRDNDLLVLQERIVTSPGKLDRIVRISDEPLIIMNDEALPAQRSLIAVKKTSHFERLDFGIILDGKDVKILFSHPLSTGSDVSFDSFSNVYRDLTRLLRQANLRERNIVRKWFLVKDIFRDYELINQVRDDWFSRWYEKDDFIPASTGIQSHIDRSGHLSLEFVAIDGDEVAIEQMHCSMQNEPIEYKKMFSRGVLASLPASRIAFISGTASTDERGGVKYLNDIKRQFQHTLDCIDDLLKSVDMGFGDIAQGIIWLKHKKDQRDCLDIAAKNDFPIDKCLLLLDCNVCRDEWLCEIEVTAFRNRQPIPI